MTQPSIADVFQVQGDTLLYNGEALNGYDAIRAGHEEQLLKILQTHKNIKLLKLTIDGGTKRIAMEMANIIIDAQLDTHVDKKCSSSCVRLLLAGTKRTANLGAQIGFHRGYWLAEGMEIYYEKHKENMAGLPPSSSLLGFTTILKKVFTCVLNTYPKEALLTI